MTVFSGELARKLSNRVKELIKVTEMGACSSMCIFAGVHKKVGHFYTCDLFEQSADCLIELRCVDCREVKK